MNEAVTKKYVKAILSDTDSSELDLFISNLDKVASVFEIQKFKNIISLPTLKSSSKVEFILSLVEKSSKKFENFISLLGANKRLELIPEISRELKTQKSIIENVYIGNVYGSYKLGAKQLKSLEENFSNRFNANIKLQGSNKDYNGIKIELNDLGIEVSFSIDRLKAQMSEYILKAI